MKIIVTHDVDHLYFSEHFFKDIFIFKWLMKNSWYFLRGRICWQLYYERITAITQGRIHNVPEVIAFDTDHNVPSTFFVGVVNGLSMSYSISAAHNMIDFIRSKGFETGVHGISFADPRGIHAEYQRFSEFLPAENKFGVRNHYLRHNKNTLKLQAQAGYLFDSSEYGLLEPYSLHGIWEFPVSMMDSYLLPGHEQVDFCFVQKKTIEIINRAEKQGLSFFTLIFHDVYYSALFPLHKMWYEWLIPFLKERFEFTHFQSAIENLEKN